MKIWCAAHRAELVWKAVAEKVDIGKVLSVMSSISSYFHSSAVRTSELQEVASQNGIKLYSLPKIFEIRWTQFSFTLLRNTLMSWNALVIYFQQNGENATCSGYLQYLTNIENLRLISFLADLLFSFQRFQKKLQSDKLTIISMIGYMKQMKNTLNHLKETHLLGGFEEKFGESITQSGDKTYLKGIELKSQGRPGRHRKKFGELRLEILEAVEKCLDDRFEADEIFMEKIRSFIEFDKKTNLSDIHTLLAADVSLSNLFLQFNDISNSDENDFKDLSLNEVLRILSKSECRDNYKELAIVLARINACTPHSADVERCISANNRLRTKLI